MSSIKHIYISKWVEKTEESGFMDQKIFRVVRLQDYVLQLETCVLNIRQITFVSNTSRYLKSTAHTKVIKLKDDAY